MNLGNLVLALKLGEPLQVGEATITILKQKSPTVFEVAIQAPREIPITRPDSRKEQL